MNRKILISCLCFLCMNSMVSQSYTATTITTPNGTVVPDVHTLISPDITLSAAQIASLRNDLRNNYNGAILIDLPSYKYNCHAYAWHVSEGGDEVWIGRYTSTAEDVYWVDGSYIEVGESDATKVSYHETGNHSAIRLSNEWYQSKWGSCALVKHHPNDVPNGYNASLPKKFYKRNLPHMSITGQTYICSFAEYSVTNLPSGATVNWTYSPINTINRPNILQNSPLTNSCTLTNTYHQVFEGYLNAEIIISGITQTTISKLIRGESDNFVGFYWQPSDEGYWVPEMSISLEEPNYAVPPYDVIIESENFRGKRVSCIVSGHTSILTSSASNRVSFEMPSLPSGELLTIRVDGSDCGSPINFTFESQTYTMSPNDIGLNITSLGSNRYNISFDTDEVPDMSGDLSLSYQSNNIGILNWTLDVYDALSNQKIMELNVARDNYILDMSSLNPGVYVVRAIMGNKASSGKIYKN